MDDGHVLHPIESFQSLLATITMLKSGDGLLSGSSIRAISIHEPRMS
jgi:hypothetical protein